MNHKDDGMKRIAKAINRIRAKIANQTFIRDHKAQPQHFTRIRTLSFQIIFMLILRKTITATIIEQMARLTRL